MKKKNLKRYFKFCIFNVPSFLSELLMLRVFLYYLHLPTFLAAGIAFVIAETISHAIVRMYVFSETTRSRRTSYFLYLIIASGSLVIISTLMHVFVEIYHFNPFLSRIGIGLLTGIWNFLMNLYVNFKVAHD